MNEHEASYFQLILSCLLSVGLGHPLESLVNQGPQLGPLTPAHGDLVQTPRGLASIHLEGFSEDLNEDGYVDPVAQAAPVVAAAPAAVYAQYAQYQPALAYAAAAAAPAYTVPQVAAYAAPQVTHQHTLGVPVQAHATYTVPHQVVHTAPQVANVVPQLHAAPAVAVAGHVHGVCHNHLGSVVPCAL